MSIFLLVNCKESEGENMITEKERELGTRFAYINILATLIVFIVLAFVIGPMKQDTTKISEH